MFKEIGLQAQNKITILLGKGSIWPFNEHVDLHFHNDYEVAMASIWICYASRTDCVFHILGEVGYLEKVTF